MTEASSYASSDQAHAFLDRLCDENLTIHITDGRHYVGKLWCTDSAANLVLGSCTEYPAPSDSIDDNLQRNFTVVVIPGHHITKIECSPHVIPTVISISLVFINKWLLSGHSDSKNIPFFVTWFQCVTTTILCYAAMHLAQYTPVLGSFPKFNFSSTICIQMLPLSVVFVFMIGLNNLCLRNLSVSFYYLARSLTTVFNVILTYVILKRPTSRNAILCCAIIVIGYGSGVSAEGTMGSLSVLGVTMGVASSLFCALQPIYTAKSLPLVQDSVWKLTFYSNFNAMILFIPFVLFTETDYLLSASLWLDFHFWSVLLISGVLGFALGYVSALQIQVTSPLTHNVSGTAKAATQTVLGVFIFDEVKSLTWWLSNAVVLFGSGAYAYVRHSEMAAKTASMCTEVKSDREASSELVSNEKKTLSV